MEEATQAGTRDDTNRLHAHDAGEIPCHETRIGVLVADNNLGRSSRPRQISVNEAVAGYAVGPPYMMHTRDWVKVIDLWIKMCPRVNERHPGILAEMYGFCIAAAHLRCARVSSNLRPQRVMAVSRAEWGGGVLNEGRWLSSQRTILSFSALFPR